MHPLHPLHRPNMALIAKKRQRVVYWAEILACAMRSVQVSPEYPTWEDAFNHQF